MTTHIPAIEAPSRRPVYLWVPDGTKRILDIGCSWGDDSFSFTKKCAHVYGVDINERSIAKAKAKYPGIKFYIAPAERLPFKDEFFDVVVMSEVLEHVRQEIVSLNESYRVLKPGGLLILTTPHKGLFGFLDPANQKFYLQKYTPTLFQWFVRTKIRHHPAYAATMAGGIHRHYSLGDIVRLFGLSAWRGNFRIRKVVRHGLVMGPLAGILGAIFKSMFGITAKKILLRPLYFLAKLDNRISFGHLSYQIEILVEKSSRYEIKMK